MEENESINLDNFDSENFKNMAEDVKFRIELIKIITDSLKDKNIDTSSYIRKDGSVFMFVNTFVSVTMKRNYEISKLQFEIAVDMDNDIEVYGYIKRFFTKKEGLRHDFCVKHTDNKVSVITYFIIDEASDLSIFLTELYDIIRETLP